MQRHIIQRPGHELGGCNILGLQFSEQFVKGVDAGLIVCFGYMVILEISHYSKYQIEAGCIKPFGLFWIGQYMSIILFRVFYHLERYARYRLGLRFLDRDDIRQRRARFRVYYMMGCKLLAFSGFLIFSVIGTIWFVQDGKCLNNLDQSSKNNTEIKMAFWLFASFTVCLIYTIRVITKLIFDRAVRRDLMQAHINERFNMFLWPDQIRQSGGRTLTKTELNAIKKFQLRNYDELSRFGSEAHRFSGKSPVNDQIPVKEDSGEVIDESDLNQDESEPSSANCAVCLENIEIGEWYKKLPTCEHCFHAECIDQWLSTRATCPICREEIFLVENGANPSAQSIRENESRFVLRFTRVVTS